MKLKNEIFINGFIPALGKFMEMNMPVLASYQLNRLAKQLDNNRDSFDKARQKLLQKYGKEQKDKTWKIDDKKEPEARKEFDKLLAVEEEYDFEKIKLSKEVFARNPNVELKPRDLTLLSSVIEI